MVRGSRSLARVALLLVLAGAVRLGVEWLATGHPRLVVGLWAGQLVVAGTVGGMVRADVKWKGPLALTGSVVSYLVLGMLGSGSTNAPATSLVDVAIDLQVILLVEVLFGLVSIKHLPRPHSVRKASIGDNEAARRAG